nr:PREDICTED: uncharacterized protein LOC105661894 [Megachile rotundata]
MDTWDTDSTEVIRAGLSPTRLCSRMRTRLKELDLGLPLHVKKEPRLRAWSCTPTLLRIVVFPYLDLNPPFPSYAAPPWSLDGFFYPPHLSSPHPRMHAHGKKGKKRKNVAN